MRALLPPIPVRLPARLRPPHVAAYRFWGLYVLLALCAWLLPLAVTSAQTLPSLAGLGMGKAGSSGTEEERAIQAQRDAANTAEQEADAFAQSLERLRNRVQVPPPALPAPLSDMELGQMLARWEERVPANASQEVLERLLSDEREAIAALKAGIEKSAAEQANLVAQPGTGRTDLATLQQRVQDSALPVAAEPGESPALTQAHVERTDVGRTVVIGRCHTGQLHALLVEIADLPQCCREAVFAAGVFDQARGQRQGEIICVRLSIRANELVWTEQLAITQRHCRGVE